MFYDPVSIRTVTADENGSSNALVSNCIILVHKVVLRQSTSGSNVVSVLINDHATIGSSATLIALSTNSQGGAAGDAYQRYASETFSPPVQFIAGVSIDVTGTSVSCSLHYTRS